MGKKTATRFIDYHFSASSPVGSSHLGPFAHKNTNIPHTSSATYILDFQSPSAEPDTSAPVASTSDPSNHPVVSEYTGRFYHMSYPPSDVPDSTRPFAPSHDTHDPASVDGQMSSFSILSYTNQEFPMDSIRPSSSPCPSVPSTPESSPGPRLGLLHIKREESPEWDADMDENGQPSLKPRFSSLPLAERASKFDRPAHRRSLSQTRRSLENHKKRRKIATFKALRAPLRLGHRKTNVSTTLQGNLSQDISPIPVDALVPRYRTFWDVVMN